MLAFTVHEALLDHVVQHFAEVFTAEFLPIAEGQFESGAAHVVHEDEQLVGGDARMFRARAQKEFRVAHDVLVERIAGGNQYAQRCSISTAGAAQALPGGGDGARVTVQQAHVERADIDAQFQRIGGHHAIDAIGAQLLFRGTPCGRQIAAAIGRDPRRLAQVLVEHVLHVFGDDLHHQPRVGEDDGLELSLHGGAGDTRGL